MNDDESELTVRASDEWVHTPGEGMFKLLLDSDAKPRGSIQFREGLFLLGARDALTRRLIFFDRSNFETEDDAVAFFNDWIGANVRVRTMA